MLYSTFLPTSSNPVVPLSTFWVSTPAYDLDGRCICWHRCILGIRGTFSIPNRMGVIRRSVNMVDDQVGIFRLDSGVVCHSSERDCALLTPTASQSHWLNMCCRYHHIRTATKPFLTPLGFQGFAYSASLLVWHIAVIYRFTTLGRSYFPSSRVYRLTFEPPFLIFRMRCFFVFKCSWMEEMLSIRLGPYESCASNWVGTAYRSTCRATIQTYQLVCGENLGKTAVANWQSRCVMSSCLWMKGW